MDHQSLRDDLMAEIGGLRADVVRANQETQQTEKKLSDAITNHETAIKTNMQAHMTNQEETIAAVMIKLTEHEAEHRALRVLTEDITNAIDNRLLAETD